MFSLLQIVDLQAIALCKKVHGEHALRVGRCRQDGLRSGHPRDPARPLIGSSQVPGQNGNHMAPFLIHDQHCRIHILPANMRCNGAHGDPAGADEQKNVSPAEILRGPFLQDPFPAHFGDGLHIGTVLRHVCRDPAGQVSSCLCEIDDV